ncbi:aldo/keto reductase [Candidatus Peregrinibacteria bacterium]|nr:aldo/keto reductase [Candidatus Peregrinibacteria bacterium]
MLTTALAPGYRISRVIKGGWQLSCGHGQYAIEMSSAIENMHAFVQAGITTFDCGDIYIGVEELIGEFLRQNPTLRPRIQLHTKYVPDMDRLSSLTEKDTELVIDRSRVRLGVDTLDVVQFHWWDYGVDRYREVYEHLLQLQQRGKIRHVGVTNFDVPHMEKLLQIQNPLSIQVQYSLLDRRPEHGMTTLCQENNVAFLAYGTVAGGLLSDKYVGMKECNFVPANRSLVKYRLIVDEFGGWDLYQALLQALEHIAQKYFVSIATIASAYILQQPAVTAVIIGARDTTHLPENIAICSTSLDTDDLDSIHAVLQKSQGPLGDVYHLERYSDRHSSIMQKSNNSLFMY